MSTNSTEIFQRVIFFSNWFHFIYPQNFTKFDIFLEKFNKYLGVDYNFGIIWDYRNLNMNTQFRNVLFNTLTTM